ncbi:MAG: endolytic transglycosylase MltG [Chloroflexi bacterium]|nr:MAG: endolytic transglycosylase MltG [Chloroflexota bacterium]
MTRRPGSWGREAERNARIRQRREQRDVPTRARRFQPVVLIGWFAAVIAALGVLLFIGFLAFAPRLMSWVEANPGTIEQGLVRDFVRWYRPDELADVAASRNATRISFQVPIGATATQIGQLLYSKGLIKSQVAFEYWVLQAGRSGSLQAGTYDLSPSMVPTQIIAALRQEAGPEVQITIREGWRLEEIVAYLAKQPLTMNLGEFVKLVKDPPPSLLNQYDYFKDLPKGRSLEGYLYPDTYRIDGNSTALEVVQRLLNEFDKRLTPQIRSQLAKNGMSIDDAVKLASIVEREAVLNKERPLIAGVYINRLRDTSQRWVLNADPTLQYGLATAKYGAAPVAQWGTIKWWQPLPDGGDKIQLPPALAGYQTYLHAGLPSSPIAAPRIASIQAVAAPQTQAGYFYFVAACPGGKRDGSHRFAQTLADQQANAAQALRECPPG